MKTLYPDISPFNSDYLVQGSHKIYFEESGNPDGKPVVFLHGHAERQRVYHLDFLTPQNKFYENPGQGNQN